MEKYRFSLLVLFAINVFSSGCRAEEVYEAVADIGFVTVDVNSGEKAFLTGDFNNDGHTDLVVAEEAADRIVVFLNNGTGTLNRKGAYPAGENPTWLTAVDFDGDGANDLAIVNHEATSITLLRGDGVGAFVPAEQSSLPIETEPHSHMIATADFNDDGFPDLIVDSRDRFGVFILRGQKGGRFKTPGHSVDVNGAPYLGFAIGDVNNDGAPDIVTPNRDNISVLLNYSSIELAFDRVSSIPFPAPFAIGLGDVTGDGQVDIIAASANETHGIVVLTGGGEGYFENSKSFAMAAGAKTIATGDVNGDGLTDAVVTSWNSDIVLLIGDIKEPILLRLPMSGIENPWGVVLGDFNGDGRDEVVIGDAASGRANVYSMKFVDE